MKTLISRKDSRPPSGHGWTQSLTNGFRLRALAATGRLCATQAFDGGILNILGTWLLKLITLIIQLAVWKALLKDGAGTEGLTVAQVLVFITLSAVLSEQLNVVSPASMSFWEGTLANRYTRPLPVVTQLMAETVGRWLPHLAFFSLPLLLLSPLLGVSLLPASMAAFGWFLLAMLMGISLGFAMDLLFAALAVYIKNAGWMALYIRNSIFLICSGSLIPLTLMPWRLGGLFRLLPFGSLANAPLGLFTGMESPFPTLAIQLFWNLVLWPIALYAYRRCEERMVAYGG